MTVDPSDPETFEANEANEAPEIDVEAPEADAAEQLTEAFPGQGDAPQEVADPDGADVADRAEQARVVEIDEDDYR